MLKYVISSIKISFKSCWNFQKQNMWIFKILILNRKKSCYISGSLAYWDIFNLVKYFFFVYFIVKKPWIYFDANFQSVAKSLYGLYEFHENCKPHIYLFIILYLYMEGERIFSMVNKILKLWNCTYMYNRV